MAFLFINDVSIKRVKHFLILIIEWLIDRKLIVSKIPFKRSEDLLFFLSLFNNN